jgi:hypothetical protein
MQSPRMVIDAPPPISAPPITAQQLADLDCLGVALAMKAEQKAQPPGGDADAMVRVYSERLRASDPARNWTAETVPPSEITYGWFMGSVRDCGARLTSPSRLPSPSPESIRASLWVRHDLADFSVQAREGPEGYRLVADCVRGCRPQVSYVQSIQDSPISLFRLWDGDDLVYSVWAGGSAYRVRVWRLSRAGMTQLLEVTSRARPDFLTGSDGTAEIRTYEAEGGTQPTHPVVWRYRDGKYSKTEVR